MEVCRLRDTPIMTFINKLDRDGRAPIELLDEIERVLKIQTAPVTWPIGMGRELKGIYHLLEDRIYVYEAAARGRVGDNRVIEGLRSPQARELLGDQADAICAEIDLVRGATARFDRDAYRAGRQSPVFFGSAISNFGVEDLLSAFVQESPGPLPRACREREVEATESRLTGFVFKIQANMDPGHRDRIAFLRVCSGHYQRGMRVPRRPMPGTSSACTTMARSTSATVSARASRCTSPACPISRPRSSGAPCSRIRCA
jgi:peptide chain release factor 3